MRVREKYENAPNVWNLSIVITLGSVLWAVLVFFVNAELTQHSTSETAHPVIMASLATLESGQLHTRIMDMDDRLCRDPDNRFYKEELIRLITQWEQIKGERFPTYLLRCANTRGTNNGNS